MNNSLPQSSNKVSGAAPSETGLVVGEAGLLTAGNFGSVDDVARSLMQATGLTGEQIQQKVNELPPEVIQLLQQTGQQEKFITIIANIAQFLASESKTPGMRFAYPLEQIFANAKLGDSDRIAQATKDLQSLSLTHGFSGEQMSSIQQKKLLDVHNMYPEKGVFELTKEEKRGKYQALLDSGTFDKQQAKLLLDRGYAGVLGKLLGGISRVASWGTIIGAILIVRLFFKIDGCSIINGTVNLGKDAIETTKEVATPIVNAGVDVAKFLGGGLTYISSALQSRVVELETLKGEKEAKEQRLLEIKQRIQVINDGESFLKFRDSDEEDALQDQEEKLEEELVDLDEKIFEAEEALRKELANQTRFNTPFKSAMDTFTEKRGDVKGRTKEQWKEFSGYVAGVGGGSGGSEGGKTIEEQKAVEEELLKKREQEEIKKKGFSRGF